MKLNRLAWLYGFLFVFVVAVWLCPIAAHANAVYTYTGQPFTVGNLAGSNLTGVLEFSTPLGLNLPYPEAYPHVGVSLVAFSFSSGVTMPLTNFNAAIYIFLGTDPSGNINHWWIEIRAPFASADSFGCGLGNCGPKGDTFQTPLFFGGTSSQGSWTIQTPEPGTLPLLIGVSLGLYKWLPKLLRNNAARV